MDGKVTVFHKKDVYRKSESVPKDKVPNISPAMESVFIALEVFMSET